MKCRTNYVCDGCGKELSATDDEYKDAKWIELNIYSSGKAAISGGREIHACSADCLKRPFELLQSAISEACASDSIIA